MSERNHLTPLRRGFIQKGKVDNHSVFFQTGNYPNGQLGEIFIDMQREGSCLRGMMTAFAMAISIGLQHGVPLTEFAEAFQDLDFQPNGYATTCNRTFKVRSVLDYIFKELLGAYVEEHFNGERKE